MSSENWQSFRLTDLVEVIGGGTPRTSIPEYWNGDIPWISVVDFQGEKKYILKTEKHISGLGLQNSSTKILKSGQVIISARGTVGELAILGKDMAFNQSCYGLDANNLTSNEFVYYLLKHNINQIKQKTNGAVFDTITRETLDNIFVEIPSLKEQQHIVEVLSALDDKIELNRQTNATLEAIAQAIFKEWFVDFRYPGATGEMVDSELGPIPRGWRVGILSEVLSSIESGSRPKGGVGDLAEGIPSIGAENINGLGFYDFSKEKFVSEEFFAKLKSGIVKSEDVLLYKDGASLGRKTMFMDGFPHQICAINEHVFILRSNNLINQLFLYFWLDQSYMTENIKSLNSNSAQPGINQPAVRSLPILIPEKTISEKFEQIVKPLLSKLFNDCKESYSLSLLRDKLLPKLMSGEIQI